MQIHIALIDIHLPPKDCRVHPQTAVCELHTLRTSRCATGVVNSCGCILVRNPWGWQFVELVQNRIRFCTDDELMFGLHIRQRLFKFRINNQHLSPAMLDDVLHFFSNESEIDGHEYAPIPTHTEERRQQPS